MANEKKYFSFLDIPDGSGSTERWHAKDAEAREALNDINEASEADIRNIVRNYAPSE